MLIGVSSGLALTARLECQVASFPPERSTSGSAKSTIADVSRLKTSLLAAVENENDFPDDAFEAKVCLAWLDWAIGDTNHAMSRIHADLGSMRERLIENDKSLTAWTQVCIVKAAYIQGQQAYPT